MEWILSRNGMEWMEGMNGKVTKISDGFSPISDHII